MFDAMNANQIEAFLKEQKGKIPHSAWVAMVMAAADAMARKAIKPSDQMLERIRVLKQAAEPGKAKKVHTGWLVLEGLAQDALTQRSPRMGESGLAQDALTQRSPRMGESGEAPSPHPRPPEGE